MKIVQKGYNALFPSAEELWDRSGATMVPVAAADGSVVDRPFYDLEVTNKDTWDKPLEVEELVTRRGRRLGFSAVHQVEVNGIDHLARAIVTDGQRDLTITSGSALTTSIGGYAHDRAIKITADTRQPHIQVGPPHSGQMLPSWLEGLRVPQTINEARATSLARTAQIEQFVFAKLSELYELPSQQVALGDSRDSITTPGQFLYTSLHGSEIVGFNTKARCMLNRMELGDLPKLGYWGAANLVGGIAVGMCLVREGQLGTLRGTSSANPNFWASTLTGNIRSLTSGEARLLIDTVPRDAHGVDTVYGRDMDGHDEIRDAWGAETHPNVHVKHVLGGGHPALLHPKAHKTTRRDIKELVNEYKANNGNVHAMDWGRIHGLKGSEEVSTNAA
jgi:hypothetical protein